MAIAKQSKIRSKEFSSNLAQGGWPSIPPPISSRIGGGSKSEDNLGIAPFTDELNEISAKFEGVLLEMLSHGAGGPPLPIPETPLEKEIKYIINRVKLYYPFVFIRSLNNKYGNYDLDIDEEISLRDQSLEIEPISFDIMLGNIVNSYRVNTITSIRSVNIRHSYAGNKISIENITFGIRISTTNLNIRQMFNRQFSIDNFYLSGFGRNINAWIRDHNPRIPLQTGNSYDLMIEIQRSAQDSIASSNIVSQKRVFELLVAIYGNGFKIENNIQKLYLPKILNSRPISIKFIPIHTGIHNIDIHFYYRMYPLKVISIPLESAWLHSPLFNPKIPKQEQLIPSVVLFSSDAEFESIIEIERLSDSDD